MARIRIPCLVGRTAKSGITSWYWQPSKTLRDAGWEPIALGKDEGRAIAAARTRNEEVERWKQGTAPAGAAVAHRDPAGTFGQLIAKYEKDVLDGTKPNGAPLIAASTARTYRTSLRRLRKWAAKHPLAYITPARVRALRDAMLRPEEQGGIGHHAAHQTLKMGRTLFAFAIACDLVENNPFKDFRLAAPPPRDVIWSPPAREAMIAAARKAAMPSIALAIQLGFAIGQREQDLLTLTVGQYIAIPEHKMQAEDFATLAALSPDGVPRGIRIRQAKTRAWIEVPIVGEVRAALEANILTARAMGSTVILIDDTRSQLYEGEAGQTRFQRDFAHVRDKAAEQAETDGMPDLAAELRTLQFRDLRRTCVVYLGELGMDAHLIAAVSGHDIDETQRILKTYMPRTTGRAARAIALASIRAAKDDDAKEKSA